MGLVGQAAPTWFKTTVDEAALFYANNFTTPKATTVTIDVGWGEVEGIAGSIPNSNYANYGITVTLTSIPYSLRER